MTTLTNRRVVESGSTVEAYYYMENPVSYNNITPETKRKKSRIIVIDEDSRQKKVETRRRSMIRAGFKLCRLINSNVWKWRNEKGKAYLPTFVTLTFEKDVRDIGTANMIFSQFIKRLNNWTSDMEETTLKYVSIPEFQDINRKVIHYHVVFFNLKFTMNDILTELWEQGITQIKKIDHVGNIGLYVSKSMFRNFEDDRFDGHKRYFTSRGLFKPTVIRDQKHADKIMHAIPWKYITERKKFVSKYHGKVLYFKFQLPGNKTLADMVPRISEITTKITKKHGYKH